MHEMPPHFRSDYWIWKSADYQRNAGCRLSGWLNVFIQQTNRGNRVFFNRTDNCKNFKYSNVNNQFGDLHLLCTIAHCPFGKVSALNCYSVNFSFESVYMENIGSFVICVMGIHLAIIFNTNQYLFDKIFRSFHQRRF